VGRDTWDSLILSENQQDALILFYTTDVVSFSQRVAAFQINLIAKYLKQVKYLPRKVQVFSYDVNAEAFPQGIKYSDSPPEDFTGEMHGTKELAASGLPKIYFVPGDDKGLPFR